MSPGIRLLVGLLAARPGTGLRAPPGTRQRPTPSTECASARPRAVLGLLTRPLTLGEMVSELERGCLLLEDVRFRPGQDTIALLSPAQFALVARALGEAHGAFRVVVPPEAAPGSPPDTIQARRRGVRLLDELVHYGASASRLVLNQGSPQAVAPGAAVPMLVRVPEL